MSDSTQNVALPEGWQRLRIGDVLTLRNGRAFKSDEWVTTGRPIIRIQNLQSKDASFNYFDGELPEQFAVRAGDLLFAWSGTPGTSFGAHIWHGPDGWINQHIFRVDFAPDAFDRDFLKLAIDANLASYIDQAQGGVGLAHITKAKLNASLLLAPPVDEQRRIAERLSQIDDCRAATADRLRRTLILVGRFRTAVLAAAGSGRLTAAWREMRGIPGWRTASANDLCAKVQSGTTPKHWHEGPGGVPFLKVYNVVDQRLDFGHRKQFIAPSLHEGAMRRARALPGDVVMNIVGPPLGKVAIITDEYPEWSINQALTLFRPSDLVTTDWLYVFLRSGISVGEIIGKTRGSVGQVNISLTQCREFQIPIPSLEEQAEIVRRAHAMLAIANRLADMIGGTETALDRSCKAAIAKAFRGELVPTEAALASEESRAYEPAHALLSRMRDRGPPGKKRGGAQAQMGNGTPSRST